MSYAKDLAKPVRSDFVRTEDDNASFTILEHIDAYIFTDSLTTTYTIPILKANQTEFGFSNLLIKYVDDTPVEEFILNYVPTQNYLNNYLEYEQTPFEGTILYEKLLNDNAITIECTQITTTYCCFVYGVPELGVPNFCGANHIAGTNCNTSDYITTVTSTVCTSTSQDFTIDAGDSGGGGGNGSPTTPIPTDTCSTARGDVGLSNGDGCLEPENPVDDDDCTVSNEDFNAYYSELSHFDVDIGLVREGCDDTIDISAVEANKKFMCIYNKLVESPSFKNLFIDTFGESENLNVKFLIDDTITSNGNAGGSYTINSQGEITTNWIIKISNSYITSASNVSMAKTILHECIHAFLKTKMLNCDLGATLPYLNNSELSEILNVFYNDWQCESDVNGSPQSQHSFMFNYMLPTFETIMTEIKPLLASEANYDYFDDINISNDNLNINEDWSWDRFIHYWSMTGLQNCTAFNETITPNAIENFMYNQYTMSESAFSANCN